jgi:hypothetical protein
MSANLADAFHHFGVYEHLLCLAEREKAFRADALPGIGMNGEYPTGCARANQSAFQLDADFLRLGLGGLQLGFTD